MKYSERTYNPLECCTFRKTKEAYGGLSNMAAGYPLIVNGIRIATSEALYQMCRYPHLIEIQQLILNQTSPMSAKMKSKANYDQSRADWEEIKVNVMRWSLRIKLAQNFKKFGLLIESTGNKPIVEESQKDKFWGAVKTEDGNLVGINALGRLLMELRELYYSPKRYDLLYISHPGIENFKLLSKDIGPVDERFSFVKSLFIGWQNNLPDNQELRLNIASCLTGLDLDPTNHFFTDNLTQSNLESNKDNETGLPKPPSLF